MADRTLKLKGEANFEDIKIQSDSLIRKLEDVQKAATKAVRTSGLASDLGEILALEAATKDRRKGAANLYQQKRDGDDSDRIKLLAKAAGETERLSSAQLKVRNLSRILGMEGLGVDILRIRELVSLVGQLGAIGGGAIAGGIGAVAGLGAVAYGYYQWKETRRLNSDIQSSSVAGNQISLDKLREMVNEAKAKGTLRGGAADDIYEQLVMLDRQNHVAGRSRSFAGGRITATVQAQIPEIMKAMREAREQSFEDEEGAALRHAEALNEISKTQTETEKAQLKAKLDSGIVSNEFYAARLRGIAEEETHGQKEILDLQEAQLKKQLDRAANDPDAQDRIRSALGGIGDARSVLDAKLEASQERIEIDRVARLSKGGSHYRMPSDELSRIGLFVGGSGDSLPELSKAQLAELKQANAQLRSLPYQISGSF